MGVKACRHEDELRPIAVHGRQNLFIESPSVIVVTRLGLERDVERVAFAGADAGLRWPSGPGKQKPRMTVKAAKQHVGSLLQKMLSAVSVMNIPVEYEYALQTVSMD